MVGVMADMKKFTVFLPVYAEYAVEVKSDAVDECGDPDWDEITEQATNELGGLCIHCAGGSYVHKKYSLELEDSPEVQYITDDEGNIVYGNPDDKLGW